MPTCETGWTLDSMPSTPTNAFHTAPPDQWERVTYSWEVAGPAQATSCNQTGQVSFNTTESESATIEVGFGEKVTISGNVSFGTSVGVGNQINVGTRGFEFVATPVVLKVTYEAGTYSTAGGFGFGGLAAFWRFLRYGVAGLLPAMTFTTDESKAKTIYKQYGWMICKKPCPD